MGMIKACACVCVLVLTDRAVPCHIKFLRSQKVVYISCGEEHTAALTKVQLPSVSLRSLGFKRSVEICLNWAFYRIMICSKINLYIWTAEVKTWKATTLHNLMS